MPDQPSILITAGPTHEPIDAVRFIGNRSSGRVGIELAEEAARRGWPVTLLLGPVGRVPTTADGVRLNRFRTCADLQSLLRRHAPEHDVFVAAAAVADFRPKVDPAQFAGKFRRTGGPLTLELEPTPDLLAEVAASRRPGQFIVGFALEPRADVLNSSRAKLERKRIDMVIGNPLETMDSDSIEPTLITTSRGPVSPGSLSKAQFAAWLIDQISHELHLRGRGANTPSTSGH